MTVTESHALNDLVTKREAAAMLRVSERTIDRYIATGRLDAVQLSPRATRVRTSSLRELTAVVAPTDVDGVGPQILPTTPEGPVADPAGSSTPLAERAS